MDMEAPMSPCRASIKRHSEPCTGLMGPVFWRDNSLKMIKQSTETICKSDKKVELGKAVDPVTHVRDVLAVLSNTEAHRYARQVRLVVYRLREMIINVNEEMKMMNRVREDLEKEHEHIVKDLAVNLDSQRLRQLRPNREKCKDGADDLLDAERVHLLNLKKQLEAQLKLIKDQLQVLNQARSRLQGVLTERSRVLELVCAAVPSTGAQSAYIKKYNRRPKSQYCLLTSTADVPCSSDPIFPVDSLGPYTPEAHGALQDGLMAAMPCPRMRCESALLIKRVIDIQKTAHNSVQQGMHQKLAETDNLKKHLTITAGETRHAMNRAQRLYDRTEAAWWHTRGPDSQRDLLTREKLDRPVLRVMQRHPGKNMPEAQEIVRSGEELLGSLRTTGYNIGLLSLAHKQLNDDIADKTAGYRVDNGVVKMRGSKAQHRWVLQARPDVMKHEI